MPFIYPEVSLTRQHGPSGYASYEEYRPWLRDDFTFRCVFCLRRERWGILRRAFELDHFVAQADDPDLTLDYDNLLYACASCNAVKGKLKVPNPCECLLQGQVTVQEDGSITATTSNARKLITLLDLDAPDYRELRRLMIGILQLANVHDPELYQLLLSYPDDLPNLALLRPPGNVRPQGLEQSHFARRERDELPATY